MYGYTYGIKVQVTLVSMLDPWRDADLPDRPVDWCRLGIETKRR